MPSVPEEGTRGPARASVRAASSAWSAVRIDAGQTVRAVVRAARHEGRERDLAAQSLKSALAALLAWLLASWLFTDSLTLMAPWVAVVLVQATVYQSLSQGIRQTVAIVLGTALATGTALVLESQALVLVLVLPVALLVGNLERFGSHGITVATSSLFALLGGPVTPQVSAERVGAAAIGALVGIAVNALIRPPRYLRDAQAAVRDATDEAADTLADLAVALDLGAADEALREAHHRAEYLPRRVTAVDAALEWDRESLRLNVRRRSTGSVLPSDYTTYDVVHAVQQVVDNTRGLARILRESTDRTSPEPALPDWFVQEYGRCLLAAAAAVEAYGRYVTGADSEEQRELTDAVGRASHSLDRIDARLDLSALPDVGAMEILGPLLSDTRRLVRGLDAG